MSSIPLAIIKTRSDACAGGGGRRACHEFAGPWVCHRIGSLSEALKRSEKGLCPLGLHPDAEADVAAGRRPLRRRWAVIRARLAGGFKGWLIYLTRRCPADANTRHFRRSQCARCEHRRRFLGLLSWCKVCGCLIRIKTAIAAAACPAKSRRWAALKVNDTNCRGLASLPVIGRAFKPGEGCGCG